MTYASTGGSADVAWGSPSPHGPWTPFPPTEPRPSSALSVISFITALIAFFVGWLPFLGLLLGALGLALGIFAVRKPVLRGLAITAIVLSTLAALTSLVTTSLFLSALFTADSTSTGSDSAATYVPEDFVDVDDRTLAGIAKDPDAHAGTTLLLYGHVTQFDANTGPCEMRVSVSATPQSSWFEYEHNALAFSGDGDSDCPELADVVADDEVRVSVVLQGGRTYSSLGGETRVPHFQVIEAEVLP